MVATLMLLRAARSGTPIEELTPLLGELPPRRRGALGALLQEMGKAGESDIAYEGPEALDRQAVVATVKLPGGGVARYQVLAERTEGAWRIVSIAGPWGSWPPAPAAAGDGLTTSSPPH